MFNNNAYRDNGQPHVHFHFIPRYKNELNIFDKVYCDKHFGYNLWKWALDEERIKIFNSIKNKFVMEN